MENENIITVQFKFSRRAIMLVVAFLFILWHPGFLGSETLTMTSYYPAPYGGYAQLLTTGNATLARDGGGVGIGVPTPTQKLEVAGGNITLTGGAMFLRTNSAVPFGAASVLSYDQGGALVLGGNGGKPYIYLRQTEGGAGASLQMNAPGELTVAGNVKTYGNTTTYGDVEIVGNLKFSGYLNGFCNYTYYQPNVWSPCPAGRFVMGAFGDGQARFRGSVDGTPINFGGDWGGYMVCCKVNPYT